MPLDRRLRPDGRFPAVVSVTALRDAAEAIIGYRLISTDNTVRTQAEADQRQLGERLRDQQFSTRSLLESSFDALFATDPSGIIADVNQQAERLTGRTRDELVGAQFRKFFTDPERAAAGIELALGQKKVTDYELTARTWDGESTIVACNAPTFQDRDRKLQGVFVAARDVTERRRLDQMSLDTNAELLRKTVALEDANVAISQVAATDDLTGLPNRRSFHESLEKAVSLARRHASPLALVSFDLDGLKGVNDGAGHAAGDKVLATFAALLDDLCRSEDVPSRLGGDEFGLLLPSVDLGGARVLVDRDLAVRSCPELVRNEVTVSGGLVAWSPDDLVDDLLRRADEALYLAKRSGGDAVTTDRDEGVAVPGPLNDRLRARGLKRSS